MPTTRLKCFEFDISGLAADKESSPPLNELLTAVFYSVPTRIVPGNSPAFTLGDDTFTTSPSGTPPSPGDGQTTQNGGHPPSGMPASEFHPYPEFMFDSSRCDTVRRKCRELCYNSGRAGSKTWGKKKKTMLFVSHCNVLLPSQNSYRFVWV